MYRPHHRPHGAITAAPSTNHTSTSPHRVVRRSDQRFETKITRRRERHPQPTSQAKRRKFNGNPNGTPQFQRSAPKPKSNPAVVFNRTNMECQPEDKRIFKQIDDVSTQSCTVRVDGEERLQLRTSSSFKEWTNMSFEAVVNNWPMWPTSTKGVKHTAREGYYPFALPERHWLALCRYAKPILHQAGPQILRRVTDSKGSHNSMAPFHKEPLQFNRKKLANGQIVETPKKWEDDQELNKSITDLCADLELPSPTSVQIAGVLPDTPAEWGQEPAGLGDYILLITLLGSASFQLAPEIPKHHNDFTNLHQRAPTIMLKARSCVLFGNHFARRLIVAKPAALYLTLRWDASCFAEDKPTPFWSAPLIAMTDLFIRQSMEHSDEQKRNAPRSPALLPQERRRSHPSPSSCSLESSSSSAWSERRRPPHQRQKKRLFPPSYHARDRRSQPVQHVQ
eukprot:TRINITY_DN58296_c0_g2_i1.p1 TRINITY_DN58296_c0_g2~~TRINITY_DN58296_c0_g2_i1.p1  ORF type:complete len:451 (-),score=-11.94 TRINITY_DN58296_c0_g2_i1:197-1549(-)